MRFRRRFGTQFLISLKCPDDFVQNGNRAEQRVSLPQARFLVAQSGQQMVERRGKINRHDADGHDFLGHASVLKPLNVDLEVGIPKEVKAVLAEFHNSGP